VRDLDHELGPERAHALGEVFELAVRIRVPAAVIDEQQCAAAGLRQVCILDPRSGRLRSKPYQYAAVTVTSLSGRT